MDQVRSHQLFSAMAISTSPVSVADDCKYLKSPHQKLSLEDFLYWLPSVIEEQDETSNSTPNGPREDLIMQLFE
jgi:hypothetical protein